MSTGTEIIESALRAIKVISSAVPSEPEQIDDGLTKLRSMLMVWLSKGINLQVIPITTAGEALDEPIEATNAIVDNLAIRLARDYSVPVSIELAANAHTSLIDITTLFQELTIPDKIVSSTLPTGQGNNKGLDAKTFFNQGQGIEN